MSAYLDRMRESIAKFEEAAATFERRTAYCRRFGPDADFQADRDRERNRAKADCAFYGARAQMYALAELAEQGRPVPAMSGPIPDRITRTNAYATPADRRFAFDHHPTIHDFRRADEFYRRYATDLDRDCPGWWATGRPMAAGLAAEAQLRRDVAAANEARDGVR